jgi:aminoglycoside phosphotransferase (APT) family kinase protein
MTSPEAALPAVRATARWLVKLHRSGVADAPVWGTDEEIAKTTLYARTLAAIAPDIGPRVSDLAEGALAGIAAHSAGVLVPTHGDFQPKNIHVSGRRITVIDFDRFALADPARDVAHFIGQSLTMSYSRTGSFAEIGPWVEAFADAYATRSGAAVPATLPFFVVRTFLEILYYKLFVRPVKDASFVPVWLDESERWLTAGMR